MGFYGGLSGSTGILWHFMGLYGGLMGSSGVLRWFNWIQWIFMGIYRGLMGSNGILEDRHPLLNLRIQLWKITVLNGKTYHFYSHFR